MSEECCKEEDHKEECCHDDCCSNPIEEAHDKVDALIGLLIKKNLITEDELQKEYESLFEDPEESSE